MKPKGGTSEGSEPVEMELSELCMQLVMLIVEGREPDHSLKGHAIGQHYPLPQGQGGAHSCHQDNAKCHRAKKLDRRVRLMCQNGVPISLQVLQLPDCYHDDLTLCCGSLLERWTLQTISRRSLEMLESPQVLLQAVRSYIHFSQISSWLSLTHGKQPKNLIYRLTVPGETLSGAAEFTAVPEEHSFPVSLTTDSASKSSLSLKVLCEALPRLADIPATTCSRPPPKGGRIAGGREPPAKNKGHPAHPPGGPSSPLNSGTSSSSPDGEESRRGGSSSPLNSVNDASDPGPEGSRLAGVGGNGGGGATTGSVQQRGSLAQSPNDGLSLLPGVFSAACHLAPEGLAEPRTEGSRLEDKRGPPLPSENGCSPSVEATFEPRTFEPRREALNSSNGSSLAPSADCVFELGRARVRRQLYGHDGEAPGTGNGQKVRLAAEKHRHATATANGSCPFGQAPPPVLHQATPDDGASQRTASSLSGHSLDRELHRLSDVPGDDGLKVERSSGLADGDVKVERVLNGNRMEADERATCTADNGYPGSRPDVSPSPSSSPGVDRPTAAAHAFPSLPNNSIGPEQREALLQTAANTASSIQRASGQPNFRKSRSLLSEAFKASTATGSPSLHSKANGILPGAASASEKARFRRSLDLCTKAAFNERTGLPVNSSPAPPRRTSPCFNYDDSALAASPASNGSSSDDDCGCLLSKSAPATTTSSLLGNFEESILNSRIEPLGMIEGFTVDIGASGDFCPHHITLPVTTFFYDLSDDNKPSPYSGFVNLEKHSRKGYHVPRKGTIQVTLFNPNKTVVKMFVVMYNLSDMPPNCQTFLRQRTFYTASPGAAATQPSGGQTPAHKELRYLVHLRFQSSRSGHVYLHTDIRMIFARNRPDLDLGNTPSYELKSYTEAPENPRFSPKK